MTSATTIAAGATASIALPAGSQLRLSGAGYTQIAPPGAGGSDNTPRSISSAESTCGPFQNSVTVNVSAAGGGVSYYIIDPREAVLQPSAPGGGSTDINIDALQSLVPGDATLLRSLSPTGLLGSVGGAGAYTIGQDMYSAPATAFGCVYPQNEGSGTTLNDSLNRGGPITVSGSTTGAWGTAGWFTHDAAGNTLQLKNIPGVDHMISLKGECEILVGMDIYYTTFPSAGNTETLWGIGRSNASSGGLRFAAEGTSTDLALFYRSNGGSENRLGVLFLSGVATYNAAVMNTLVAIRVLPALNELRYRYFLNGRVELAGYTTLDTIPTTDSTAGLNFSGYGATPSSKLGAAGSVGCRTRNAFCFRHDGRDQLLAARLAKYVAVNSALPSWLKTT